MGTLNFQSVEQDRRDGAVDDEASKLLVFGGARWLGLTQEARRTGADPGPACPPILGSAHGPRLLEILNGVAA